MLGLIDFYKTSNIKVYQIIPLFDKTLDIPDMSVEFNSIIEPVWKWLVADWAFLIAKNSVAFTNVNTLLGERVTEVTRWEDDEWEMFAGSGSELDKEDICAVPVATLLSIDNSLEAVLNVDVGSGLWRNNDELSWTDWN